MIKSNDFIQPLELALLVPNGRTFSARAKKLFRSRTLSASRSKTDISVGTHEINTGSDSRNQEITCYVCTKPVSPPCFLCLTCSMFTLHFHYIRITYLSGPDLLFICKSCEEQKKEPENKVLVGDHTQQHRLLWIYDDAEDEDDENVDPKILHIQKRLTDVESKVDTCLAILKALVDRKPEGSGAVMA